MVDNSRNIRFAKVALKDQGFKVKKSWQMSRNGKNALTKDPAYKIII